MTPSEAQFEEFFGAYIECALWSETDENGNPLDKRFERKHIAPDSLQRMRDDCVKFWEANSAKVDGNYIGSARDSRDAQHAGHDFWLTRNCHGAGFWDGSWCDEVSDDLDKAAHEFGECNLYIGDDRKVHSYPPYCKPFADEP